MKKNRIAREQKTIKTMLSCYCQDIHQSNGDLCSECAEILAYAEQRLSKCPFQDEKPNCADCQVHCYKKDMREKVKEVMRYAGPKMLVQHPVLALGHIFQGVKGKIKKL